MPTVICYGLDVVSDMHRFCWQKKIRAFLQIVGLPFVNIDMLGKSWVYKFYPRHMFCSIYVSAVGVVVVYVVIYYQVVDFSQVYEET